MLHNSSQVRLSLAHRHHLNHCRQRLNRNAPHIAHKHGRRQQIRRPNRGHVLAALRSEHEKLRSTLRMPNVIQLPFAGLLQNVINASRQIVDAHLVPREIPEFQAVAGISLRLQLDVTL